LKHQPFLNAIVLESLTAWKTLQFSKPRYSGSHFFSRLILIADQSLVAKSLLVATRSPVVGGPPLKNGIPISEMATQFNFFPLFPKEIQIKIWKLACEVPRVIELGATPKNWLYRDRAVGKVNIWERIKITSNSSRSTLIPAVLETCFLSREIALKYYGSQECSIFNPDIDTLYFGPEFDFIRGWDHWDKLAYRTDIRHFAFHLPTFRCRQDFYCMEQVAWERQVEGITFMLDAPSESSGDAVAPRFRIIDHQEIASDKALRTVGKVFKEAQSVTITGSYDFHNACFRQSGRYPDDEFWQWKMPKIKFMLEDEQRAQQDRKARRVRRELAAIAEEAEYKAKT
jgi:hypothetical protein